jgi:chromosome segregation ATPase
MESTTTAVSEMSAEQPVKLTNAERLAALEESRSTTENALAEVRGQSAGLQAKLEESRSTTENALAEVRGQSAGLQAKLEESRSTTENALAEIRGQSTALRATVETQRQLIDELSVRVQGLDRLVKEQNAFMDELEKDMKEAFKNNGRTVAGWLEEKDRQFAALRGSGGMEGRVEQLEELVRRLQYRVATR